MAPLSAGSSGWTRSCLGDLAWPFYLLWTVYIKTPGHAACRSRDSPQNRPGFLGATAGRRSSSCLAITDFILSDSSCDREFRRPCRRKNTAAAGVARVPAPRTRRQADRSGYFTGAWPTAGGKDRTACPLWLSHPEGIHVRRERR